MTLRVDTVALGPVAVGARTFTRRGVRRLVAIVKATCELVPDGSMRLLAPTPLRDSELGLRIPRTQVVVVSASHAPAHGGGVRVAVARGDAMLLDKRVDAPAGMPAGLGPLPAEAPVRRARLGSAPQDGVARAFDVALPDDFDDAWFMTVPPDQCTSAPLVGGDLLVLVHLHPERATLRTHLPAGHAVALLQTERGARVPIRLKLDTVTVLPEAMRAELLWRGDIQVDDEALRDARVGGAHGRGEADFPDLATLPTFAARAPVLAGGDGPGRARTAVFDPGSDASIPRRAREATVLLEAPAEPPRRARAGTMVIEADAASTAATTDDEEAAPETRVMPQTSDLALEQTHDADAVVPSPRSMPFRSRRPSAPPPGARRAPLPGAPWSAQQARRAPRARGDESSTMVLEVEAPPPIAPAAPAPPAASPPPAAVAPPPAAPSTPPPSADPPSSPEDARAPKNPWRQDPADEPIVAPSSPAGRPTRQRVSFKSDLYRKFKK